ncbi:MAG TPA: S9 family peptidase [Thermoanaerobaculia bacterium]
MDTFVRRDGACPRPRVAPTTLLVFLFAAAFARAAEPKLPDDLASSLDRIFAKKEFKAKTFGPARWLDGGKAYTTVEDSAGDKGVKGGHDIVRYDTATGERRVLVSASALTEAGSGGKPPEIDDYSWSKDGSKLLLFTNTKKVWRRNTRGDYWILDLKGGSLHRVGGSAPESSLKFAKLSPDSTRVAYVHANNLYVQNLSDWLISRLTADGSGTIVNGTSDWVYEEEFELRDAYRWSPDGKQIAFWRFDTTGVGSFALINDTDTVYPVVTQIPYPKAGTPNSAVKIGIVDATGSTPAPVARFVALPGDPREGYVPRMEWVDSAASKGGELVLQQLDRLQNTDDVWLADAKTGASKKLFRDQDEAWVDVVDSWQWLPGGKDLLWVSERDGWRHAWAAPHDGGELRLLTPGQFDIAAVAGVDEKGGWLYFTASPDDAARLYLYRAPFRGAGSPERVTPADKPGKHAYDVSPDGSWAFHTVSTIDRPPVTELVRLPSHQVARVLEDNHAVAAAVAASKSPATEFFKVDLGDGVTLDGWMLKPPGFDPSKKWPLLMYVYGEPAGAEVQDHWFGDRMLFHRALANAGYVVACVDNRGTPALKGRAWRKIIYGRVGVLASKEQAAAVRRLLAQHAYLDPERVASWGWSGGGSMTLNLLFRSPDLYRVGMSVAPVPDQTLYDTIYQERYMGLPQDNADGYKEGSPINFAEGLRGNLLLVHGTGDDNVHFQGSQKLINRLVALDKPFDFMEYPNRTHAISEGDGTSLHLHSLLARYLLEHLPAGAK